LNAEQVRVDRMRFRCLLNRLHENYARERSVGKLLVSLLSSLNEISTLRWTQTSDGYETSSSER